MAAGITNTTITGTMITEILSEGTAIIRTTTITTRTTIITMRMVTEGETISRMDTEMAEEVITTIMEGIAIIRIQILDKIIMALTTTILKKTTILRRIIMLMRSTKLTSMKRNIRNLKNSKNGRTSGKK